MTAPDPLTAHTSAAIDRLLDDVRGRYALTPAERVGQIRTGIRQIRDSGACSIVDKRLTWLLDDLADVVEQLAGQMGGARLEAWFGAWECGCSDTERSQLGIPEFCPVHGRRLISNSVGSTKVQLNHSGVSGYGFKAGPS